MREVIIRKSKIEDLIGLHVNTKCEYSNLLKNIKTRYPNWNEMKDVRIIPIKLIIENIQTDIIILNLIKEHFSNLELWNIQDFSNISKTQFLDDRLYFILGHLKSSLFINIFLQYEHFVRLIANHIGLTIQKINGLSKKVVSNLKLNIDYFNLIDIYTFSRNTIHFDGIHTHESKTIIYKEKKYEFTQNAHLDFFDDDTFHYIICEIGNYMSNIINSDVVKSASEIIHTYSNFKFTYDDNIA